MTCACFICSQNIIFASASADGDGVSASAAVVVAAKSVRTCVCVCIASHTLLWLPSLDVCWLSIISNVANSLPARGGYFLWFHSDFKSNFDMRSEY